MNAFRVSLSKIAKLQVIRNNFIYKPIKPYGSILPASSVYTIKFANYTTSKRLMYEFRYKDENNNTQIEEDPLKKEVKIMKLDIELMKSKLNEVNNKLEVIEKNKKKENKSTQDTYDFIISFLIYSFTTAFISVVVVIALFYCG